MEIKIRETCVGEHSPVYIVAELSANWVNLDTAFRAVSTIKQIGCQAIKTQCYSAGTITVKKDISILDGEWAGETYWNLYSRAAMPREWHKILSEEAHRIGLDYLCSPFSEEDADYIEPFVDAYKIASFELVDLPLMEHVAKKKLPVVLSTGMATFSEIDRAVEILKRNLTPFILLHCNSNYPAREEDIDITRMRGLSIYEYPVGFSDHTRGVQAGIVAVSLGASLIEKHFSPDEMYTPDSAFSLGVSGFGQYVKAIRQAEEMLKPRELNRDYLMSRPSLWVIKDIKAGEKFTPENVKSLRPNLGMEIRKYWNVLESVAAIDILANTPLTKDMVA